MAHICMHTTSSLKQVTPGCKKHTVISECKKYPHQGQRKTFLSMELKTAGKWVFLASVTDRKSQDFRFVNGQAANVTQICKYKAESLQNYLLSTQTPCISVIVAKV